MQQHLILLPGLASDAGLWREQLPALAARHFVHVSDVHFRFDSLPEMAAALLAEAPPGAVLVGSSMGGMLALEAARQQPGRVRAIALLGSSARADTPEQIRLRTDACALFAAGRMDEVLRANLPFAFHGGGAGREHLVDGYFEMIHRAGPQALVRQNRAVMARADLRATLPALRCPLLVVCGRSDLLTPPECSQEIAAAVPGAELVLLDDCGHLLTMEQPEAVNRLLLDWLASLPPLGAPGRPQPLSSGA